MRPDRVLRRNQEGFEIDDDNARLDFDVVHGFLSRSSWSAGISKAIVERAARSSWSFGLYAPSDAQVGFARLVTDYETFAYLADVFVLEAFRSQGLSAFMLEAIMAQPAISGLRRIMLATSDAHGLYEKFGFAPPSRPEVFMEIARPDIYASLVNARAAR